jgi:glutathione S-transferase
MKLYYSPGVCSLSPHIAIRELGLPVEIEKVDLGTKKTEKGVDFLTVNPKGQVPVLELDDGQILTEGPVIVQYLADRKPEVGLLPAAGSLDRYRVQEWLNHVTSELHKRYGILFSRSMPDEAKTIVRNELMSKYRAIDSHLKGKAYLLGDRFTVADGYLFTVTNWAGHVALDFSGLPNLQAFQKRVAERPAVREAMKHEGLGK